MTTTKLSRILLLSNSCKGWFSMIRRTSFTKSWPVGLLAMFVALGSMPHQAFAIPVPITNASFESPAIVPPAGHISNVIPTDWTGTSSTASTGPGQSFMIRNLLQRFPSIHPNAPVDNQWVQLLAFRAGSTPQMTISQDLGAANAIAEGTYTFSVHAGFDNTSVNAQLNYGGRASVYGNGGSGAPLLSFEIPPDSLTPGVFTFFSNSFTVLAGDPVIGTNLVLRLEADRPPSTASLAASVISYDGVGLDFQPIPEPSAIIIMVLGAAGLGMLAANKRRLGVQ